MDSGIVNRLIWLIDEAPADRSEKEILELLPHLTEKNFALGGMSRDTLVDVLKHAKHRKLKKNRFLKKATGSNDRLYLVLTGGLSMFMEWQESVLPSIVDNKDSQIRSVRQFGFRVDSLGPGKIVEERFRMENVHMITDADTDLMVISKHLYERAMQSKMERETEAKDLFIKTHPFFCKWTEQQQSELKGALLKKTYKYSEIINKQGDPFSGLFFLVKGRAKLSAEPRKHRKQFENIFEGNDMDRELAEIIRIHIPKKVDTMVSRGDTKGSHMDEKTYLRRFDGYVAAEKVEFEKVIDVCIVCAGEIFGELELLLGLSTNVFTVISMTDGCEAFVLPEKQIKSHLSQKKSPISLKLMKFLSETKLTGRMSTTQGQKVDLFPRLVNRLRQLRIKVPKRQLAITNDVSGAKKSVQENKHLSVEELDTNFLKKSFLKDKGPFLKPFTPGTVYFKEIMRQRIEERTGTDFQGHREKFTNKLEREQQKLDYNTINKRLKASIADSVKEGIRAEKVIKRLNLCWNKSTLPKP